MLALGAVEKDDLESELLKLEEENRYRHTPGGRPRAFFTSSFKYQNKKELYKS